MSTFKLERPIKTELKQQSTFFTMVKSVLFAYFFTTVTFIIYGTLLTYTEMTEKNIQLVVMITTVISVIISGFITARGISSKGLLFGMLSGLLYATITVMVSVCIVPVISFNLKTLLVIVLSIFGGGLGGIIGINTKK